MPIYEQVEQLAQGELVETDDHINKWTDNLDALYEEVRVVVLVVIADDKDVVTGDSQFELPFPDLVGDYNLVGLDAYHTTAGGGSGTTDIQIRRVRAATPQDVLSTVLTIDNGEDDSTTAATPPVINTSFDDAEHADRWNVDVDNVPSTPPLGLKVELRYGRLASDTAP